MEHFSIWQIEALQHPNDSSWKIDTWSAADKSALIMLRSDFPQAPLPKQQCKQFQNQSNSKYPSEISCVYTCCKRFSAVPEYLQSVSRFNEGFSLSSRLRFLCCRASERKKEIWTQIMEKFINKAPSGEAMENLHNVEQIRSGVFNDNWWRKTGESSKAFNAVPR